MAGDVEAAQEILRRRARCKIPGEVRHREKWRVALDMLDEITGPAGGGWGLPAHTVVTDAGYGDNTTFCLALQDRGLPYVAAVKGTTSAYPASAVPERLPSQRRPRAPALYRARPPAAARYRGQPSSLRALALAGWHRHVTLTALAQAFCTQLRYDPKAPAPA